MRQILKIFRALILPVFFSMHLYTYPYAPEPKVDPILYLEKKGPEFYSTKEAGVILS